MKPHGPLGTPGEPDFGPTVRVASAPVGAEGEDGEGEGGAQEDRGGEQRDRGRPGGN